MEGWNVTMDENTQEKFVEKLKELLAMAKKKKNVIEYHEIGDRTPVKNSLTKFWRLWNKTVLMYFE